MVEAHNEDSLFWALPLNQLFRGDLPVGIGDELEKQFGAWVKCGTARRPRATSAWGTFRRPRDNWRLVRSRSWERITWGRMVVIYEYAGQTARAGDFVEVLAQTQRAYYEGRKLSRD